METERDKVRELAEEIVRLLTGGDDTVVQANAGAVEDLLAERDKHYRDREASLQMSSSVRLGSKRLEEEIGQLKAERDRAALEAIENQADGDRARAELIQEQRARRRAEAERDRALGEGAGLRELLSRACMGLSDAADEATRDADRDHYAAGTREITEALTHASPLSKLAGEVLRLVIADRKASLAGGMRSRRQSIRDKTAIGEAVDALRAARAGRGEGE